MSNIKRKRPTKKPTWRNLDNEIREPEFYQKYYAEEEQELEKDGFPSVIKISEPLPAAIW